MNFIKSILNKALGLAVTPINAEILNLKQDLFNNQATRRQLFLYYQMLKNSRQPLPIFQGSVWKNLEAISPRVVVVEYQDILGHEKALTVPYKPDFNRFDVHEDFFSASLPAFVKLGKEKGFRLVGVNKYGFNAFFIKNELGEDVLPEIKASECFGHPKVKEGIRERYPKIKDLPWIEV